MEVPVTIAKVIEEKLRASLTVQDILLQDKSGGCGASFLCVIVAEEFGSMKLLERQQRVNQILAEEIAQIHAFELKTWTMEVWEKKKSEFGL